MKDKEQKKKDFEDAEEGARRKQEHLCDGLREDAGQPGFRAAEDHPAMRAETTES